MLAPLARSAARALPCGRKLATTGAVAGKGYSPNGEKNSGVTKVTAVDAYTQIHKLTDRKVGGEEKSDLEVTYKRVK